MGEGGKKRDAQETPHSISLHFTISNYFHHLSTVLQVRYAGMTGAQIERARAKERGHGQAGLFGHSSLSDEHHYAFLDMLQALTVSRRYSPVPYPICTRTIVTKNKFSFNHPIASLGPQTPLIMSLSTHPLIHLFTHPPHPSIHPIHPSIHPPIHDRHIKEAMGFAFDHIDCAKDICHMLRRALMAEAPVAAKVLETKTTNNTIPYN